MASLENDSSEDEQETDRDTKEFEELTCATLKDQAYCEEAKLRLGIEDVTYCEDRIKKLSCTTDLQREFLELEGSSFAVVDEQLHESSSGEKFEDEQTSAHHYPAGNTKHLEGVHSDYGGIMKSRGNPYKWKTPIRSAGGSISDTGATSMSRRKKLTTMLPLGLPKGLGSTDSEDPLSLAFVMYASKTLPDLQREMPDLSDDELLAVQQKSWQALEDAEREFWLDEQFKYKVRYQKAIELYARNADIHVDQETDSDDLNEKIDHIGRGRVMRGRSSPKRRGTRVRTPPLSESAVKL